MKKILILFVSYLSLGIVISSIKSCDLIMQYDAWVVDIEFEGINKSHSSDIDSLTNDIGFQIKALESPSSVSILNDLHFFTRCYALTKCIEWQNHLEVSSFSLIFDKRVVYNSDTIEPEIDIFGIESIRRDISINRDDYDCKYVLYTMDFSSELINSLTFEKGVYVVSFLCKTTDGKEFSKSRKIMFKQN